MASKTNLSIGVLGGTGRVGQMIVRELDSGAWKNMELAGTAGRTDTDALFTRADALIDFTAPEATAKHVWLAAKHHKPLVIGTTGLSAAQEQEIRDAAKECAIVYAANMSLGVNLMLALVEQTAACLGPAWDIEIMETHHRNKKDSPSGTALALGRAAEKGCGLEAPFVTDRTGARAADTIGFAVQRGGDVVGEHTVSFFGAGERLSLQHVATDRSLFARGALHAAQWAATQPHGLYSMQDVLGL